MMTASVEAQIADHGARITSLESGREAERKERQRLDDKLDGIKNWIMGTLAAALLSLLGTVLSLLKH
jgi:hypothetical protein